MRLGRRKAHGAIFWGYWSVHDSIESLSEWSTEESVFIRNQWREQAHGEQRLTRPEFEWSTANPTLFLHRARAPGQPRLMLDVRQKKNLIWWMLSKFVTGSFRLFFRNVLGFSSSVKFVVSRVDSLWNSWALIYIFGCNPTFSNRIGRRGSLRVLAVWQEVSGDKLWRISRETSIHALVFAEEWSCDAWSSKQMTKKSNKMLR